MSTPRKIEHSRGISWEITYRIDGRMVRQRFATKTLALDAVASAASQPGDSAGHRVEDTCGSSPPSLTVHLEALAQKTNVC